MTTLENAYLHKRKGELHTCTPETSRRDEGFVCLHVFPKDQKFKVHHTIHCGGRRASKGWIRLWEDIVQRDRCVSPVPWLSGRASTKGWIRATGRHRPAGSHSKILHLLGHIQVNVAQIILYMRKLNSEACCIRFSMVQFLHNIFHVV